MAERLKSKRLFLDGINGINADENACWPEAITRFSHSVYCVICVSIVQFSMESQRV